MVRAEEQKTKRLIWEIEKNPCLYDKDAPSYKDIELKDEIWNKIASGVDMTLKEAKQRWKSVRDNMRKNVMKNKWSKRAKTSRQYKFAGILEFLIPFLEDKESTVYIDKDETPLDTNDYLADEKEESSNDLTVVKSEPRASSNTRLISATPTTSPINQGKRKLNVETNEGVDVAFVNFLTEKNNEMIKKRNVHSLEEDDDIDQFMKSMAHTIRKLPAHAKADVKYKIHGIVHQAEMMYMFSKDDAS